MTPAELTAASFANYPPEGRAFAQAHLAVLRDMPLSLLPNFLEEIRSYDWRFPPEQVQLSHRVEWLGRLSPQARQQALAPFAAITLSNELQSVNWVDDPPTFQAALSAHLWSSGQIDGYRKAAVTLWEAMPTPTAADLPAPVVLVAMGEGARNADYQLFRKLRPLGLYAKNVSGENGPEALTTLLTTRAAQHPAPYSHWYFDGGATLWPTAPSGVALASVSYGALAPMNRSVLAAMDQAISQGTGPEVLQHRLSHAEPGPFGAESVTPDPRLQRFYLSLLTGGSGTQIFSTSFVQWAAHETLRRAQPSTMLLRFAPRRKQEPMNSMVHVDSATPMAYDADGSLIDADMAAYYTWLEMARQPNANRAVLLAWAAERREAMLIGPAVTKGAELSSPASIESLLKLALS